MNRNKRIRTNRKPDNLQQYEIQHQLLSYKKEGAEIIFSNTSLVTICESIQLLVQELYKRGYPVYDFDNKEKYVQGIRIIKNKVYFLAAEEAEHEEKKESGKI